MGYEIIDEYPGEYGEPGTVIAWVSELGERDIGVRAVVNDHLSLELIEFSDKKQREYGRIFMSREEFNTLSELIDYAKGKWGLTLQ